MSRYPALRGLQMLGRSALAGSVLAENHQGFGADAVVLHGLRGLLGLHDLLEDGEVGDLDDHPDPVGSARVAEGAGRDAVRSEKLFPLPGLEPVLYVVDLMKS